MSVEPGTITASSVFWWADQSAGWIYLLPPLENRRILCVDPTIEISWLLNHSCRAVTIACTSPEAATEAGRGRGELPLERVHWMSLDDLLEAAQYNRPDGTQFDGLVIHDPQARLLQTRGIAAVERILSAIPRLLTRDAFAYLGARRRYSLFRPHADSRAPAGTSPLLSHTILRRRLRDSGLSRMRSFPFLLDRSRIVEIVLGRYRATTNGETRRERIKELLLSERGAGLFAPAYGHVAVGPGTASTVLEEVVHAVAAAMNVAPERLRPVQCRLARGDKAIFAFEDTERRIEPTVAVVSEDPRVTRGRRTEAAILSRLALLPDPISRCVPRHIGEFAVGRYACFVMTMLPGVTLDAASDSLEPLQHQALKFLQILHQATAAPAVLDEAGFAQHFDSLLQDAVVRNPEQAAELSGLGAAVKQAIGGMTLPTVFTHGDFKIENVMYTRSDLRMTGVIDWEHAAERALPLIDPLYLLFYSRTLRGASWMDALGSIVVRQELDASEQNCVDEYLRSLGVPLSVFTPLAAVFLVHHIGRRVTLSLDADLHARLRTIIDGLTAKIRAEMPAAA